jgi:hypothetical protein
MRINREAKPVVFDGEDGSRLSIRGSNRGEPFREVVEFDMECGRDWIGVALTESEVRRLHKFLCEYLEPTNDN